MRIVAKMAKKFVFYISVIFFLKYVTAADMTSLTFVIDDTPSMRDDILDVRRSVGQIFDMVTNYKDTTQIDNFILVLFNDRSRDRFEPDLRVFAKTNRRDVFLSALDRITPGSGVAGGTCQELPLLGIQKGIEESLPKSTIYVFTDASSRDYEKFEEVKRAALEKQISVVFVLTGTCGEGPTSPGVKVYTDLAIATNGQIFHTNKGQTGKILDYVKQTVTGPRTPIVSKDLPPGKNTFGFNTDPKMNNVLVSVTSNNPNSPGVAVKGPDGSQTPTNLITETNSAKVFEVKPTQNGPHTVEVNSPSEPTHTVVSATTDVTFNHGFSTFIPNTLAETSIRPAPGNNHLSIKLSDGNIDLKSVRILDMNQNLIQELPLSLTNKDEKLYTTQQFEAPGNTFLIAIVGTDPVTKSNIVRQAPTPVEAQKTLPGDNIINKPVKIEIQGGVRVSAKSGQRLQIVCKVEGYPRPAIVWKNQDGVVLSEQVSPGKNIPYDYVNILTINKIDRTERYTCEARNVLNTDSKEVTVEVTQTSFLKITGTTQSLISYCKKQSEIYCTVQSEPDANVKWYKNGIPIQPRSHYVFTTISTTPGNNKHSLLINNPTPADNGKYTCQVSNGLETKTLDHFFAALECNDGVAIDKGVTNINAVKGQRVTIECKILRGDPKPKITWSFVTLQGYTFSLNNWQDKETNILTHVGANDAGKYVCRADNGKGRDIHDVTLNVN